MHTSAQAHDTEAPPPSGAHPSSPYNSLAQAPQSTYRLQLRPNMTMDAVLESLDYLKELGISHVYFSPYFRAVPGSTHGYDIVDFCQVDTQWGEDGHRRVCQELRARGLGHVLDMVPNHMGVHTQDNRYWWDVLRRGKSSQFARYFDVDWNLEPTGKIVLPILGRDLRSALEAGLLRIVRDQRDGHVLAIGEHILPINDEGEHFLAERVTARVSSDVQEFQKLLNLQFYRLVSFKRGASAINYRRFMDVCGLAGIRVEDPEVFDAVHRRLASWVAEGLVDGIRIDHPDGLADPAGYFERLREMAPGAWIVAEKILEPGQELPRGWAVDGTTGYEFMSTAGGLFVEGKNEGQLSKIYEDFVGKENINYEAILSECKSLALSELLEAEVNRLADVAYRFGASVGRDTTRARLCDALLALTLALPVGRTYFAQGQGSVSDLALLRETCARALSRAPDCKEELELLYAAFLEKGETETGRVARDLVARLQQLTCAASAKGAEDTALYRYSRLCSLNDLGCDPRRFSTTVAEFHELCSTIQHERPSTMSTTSTHDTKRSEDVRLRIHVISEMPEAWEKTVEKCHEATERLGLSIDREMEYLLYQTMLGTWPITEERLINYAIKATREAKVHTSWLKPDVTYEEKVSDFIRATLADPQFRHAMSDFVVRVTPVAYVHSLSQTLLKMTAPGIPDVYQGTELWDDSLVDPDNRRPVDFSTRLALLKELETLTPAEILARLDEGLPKLWVIRQSLRLRSRRPEIFGQESSHRPLQATGSRAQNIVAFSRGEELVTVVPRLCAGGEVWGDTALVLPPGDWLDVLSHTRHPAGEQSIGVLFQSFPVCLLVRVQEDK